jgi:predicted glycosyltransferase
VLRELGLDPQRLIAVFRPPPYRALYHQMTNDHFDDVLAEARRQDAQIVLLPRDAEQARRYGEGAIVAHHAVDGPSLLALADLVVGAGGTMNRESALLGTPTYTVFAGELAAVDTELIRRGLLYDLRNENAEPEFRKREASYSRPTLEGRAIMTTIVQTLDSTVRWH